MTDIGNHEGVRKRLLDQLRVLRPSFEMTASTCVGCRKCAANCNWKVTGASQTYPHERGSLTRACIEHARSPLMSGLLSRLGMLDRISDKDAQLLIDEAFGGCTLCGRCGLACTQGVSTRSYMQMIRQAATQAGLAPAIFQTMQRNALEFGQTFGKTYDETTGRVIRGVHERGYEIPVDKIGANCLWVCSSIAFANDPDGVMDITELLCRSGCSFTASSRLLETGTEIHTGVQDRELSRQFVQRIIDEMQRLQCKMLIVGECGCDTRVFLVDYARELNEAGVQVVPIGFVLMEAIRSGKLQIKCRLPLTATIHDPCWSTRLAGVDDLVRELLGHCVDSIYEWSPNRKQNLCCNGGAGSMRRYPASSNEHHARRIASEPKAEQIRSAKERGGAQIVVSPCVTCVMSLRDTIRTWGEEKGLGNMTAYSSLHLIYAAATGKELVAN